MATNKFQKMWNWSILVGPCPELVNPTLFLLISIHKLLDLTYEPCALNAEFEPTFTSLGSGYG